MVPIARIYFHIRETFPTSEYETIGGKIYEYVHTIEQSFLPGLEKGIEITIEEGSTKTWIVIGTLLNAFITYGAIRQSVDYLVKDGNFVSNKISSYLKDAWQLKHSDIISQRKDAGVSSQLKTLFESVETGRLTSNEASVKAVALIKPYVEPGDNSEFIIISSKLNSELISAHKNAANLGPSRILISKANGSEDEAKRVATPAYPMDKRPEVVRSVAPVKRIPHDLSRPKRLVILKRPHDDFPVFEYR